MVLGNLSVAVRIVSEKKIPLSELHLHVIDVSCLIDAFSVFFSTLNRLSDDLLVPVCPGPRIRGKNTRENNVTRWCALFGKIVTANF